MNNDYSLIQVLKTLARWKKHIYIATGLVALMSVIGALMMPDYYESSAILYAASPTLAKPDPIGGGEKVSYTYGAGEDLDRLFSISNSAAVKNHIIEKFNLAEHYDIDTSTPKGKAKLAQKFNKYYQTKKTKFDGLRLSIEDTDPEKAMLMVKEARTQIEEVGIKIIKDSQWKSILALKDAIDSQEKNLKLSGDSLTILKKKYGIYDSYSQAEAFAIMTSKTQGELAGKRAQLQTMKKYRVKRDSVNSVIAQIAGLESKKAKMDSVINLFNEGVLSVRLMETAQNKGVDEVSFEKERLKKMKASFEKTFPVIHTIEAESMPYEKIRPKRSIIVLGLTMLAFVMSCLMVLLIEGTKEINWREIYAGR